MSIDSKIFKVCDHKIYEEEVQIDSDLKTIRIPRTLTSQKILLYINGFLVDQSNKENGWYIEADETSQLTKKSKIVFLRKRRSSSDFYLITYSTESVVCPKCFGLKYHDDISYSTLGKLNIVANEDKLLQEVRKGISTYLGSNPFHTWIGTQIHKLIGNKITSVDFVRANILQEVTDYLDKYLQIQTKQSKYQDITARESFLKTLFIDASQDRFDPSIWEISIIFQNRTGNEMLYEKRIEIPGYQIDEIRKTLQN
jgi:hypothetical protein